MLVISPEQAPVNHTESTEAWNGYVQPRARDVRCGVQWLPANSEFRLEI